jgi:GrpB-like predicted nucleotidyltransferase (UPF0157 family)
MAELVVGIVAFQEDWFDKYTQERMLLQAVVKDVAQGIEHIGSTSVWGVAAKPIIDIAVRIAAAFSGKGIYSRSQAIDRVQWPVLIRRYVEEHGSIS